MSRPTILITNDDGIDAAGIASLRAAMEPLGDVWVVAPQHEQSAVSNAISLRDPLRVDRRGPQHVAVSGTPTDCVYIALNHLLESPPDLCVSGINHGANLGDDVMYSGTVAAAIEATLCEVPSIAFSLAGYGVRNFEPLTEHIQFLARQVMARHMPRDMFINVNFPPEVSSDTQVKTTKLGRRNYGRVVVEKEDPRRRAYYWLGGAELGFHDMPGSDCNAVADGFISMTPVSLDLTHYRFMDEMRRWTDEGSTKGSQN